MQAAINERLKSLESEFLNARYQKTLLRPSHLPCAAPQTEAGQNAQADEQAEQSLGADAKRRRG
jgi:hypothetical protein